MSKHPAVIFFFLILILSDIAKAQQQKDSLLQQADIQQCVQYALAHQVTIKQSLIDQQIVDAEIKTRLADWYPQISLDYTLEHYLKVPTFSTSGTAKNISLVYFSASQNIFNPDVLLATRTATDVRTEAKQITVNDKINLVLNISKAFYDVLLAQQQINLVNQDIARLARTVKDSYNQYIAGVVDKTDYKRAQITLNNSIAQKKQYEEQLNASFSVLKLLMGYPQPASFGLVYDSLQQTKEINLDTLQEVDYTNRIEYKILQTQQKLAEAEVRYYKWSYFPTVSAFGNYNFTYANKSFSKLYSHDFPSSYIGLTLSLPIFQGGRRTWEIRGANLQLTRLNYNFISLRDSIQSQYTQALATYKSNLNDYYVQHENLDLANDVYNTIYLQYRAGVKTYLDVIVAESDLRSTQVNYLNALYEVLKSKLDVEKALGTLTY